MIGDQSSFCSPFVNLASDAVADLVKLILSLLVINWDTFVDEASQEWGWSCIDQNWVALIKVIKSEAGATRQCDRQVENCAIVRLKHRVMGPAEVHIVCEPHEAQIAHDTADKDAQRMQICQVLHPNDQVEVHCEDQSCEGCDGACPQIGWVAFWWIQDAWVTVGYERDIEDDCRMHESLELRKEELSTVE